MPVGGRRENAGRKSGGKNKATIERELIAARQIDDARNSGKPLAKEVLQKLMEIAEGATGVNRPTTQSDLLNGKPANPDGSWDRFGEWFDRTAFVAAKLAQYQSPTFKAVAVSMTQPEPREEPKTIEGKVIDLNDPKVPGRVYLQMAKATAR